MARRLCTSISETARLVGCSRSTVVSIYAKWMNDGETSSRRHGVGRLHATKEKSHWRLSRMVKQNRSQTVAQLTAQYNARPSRIVLKHTVQRTLLDMGLRSKRPTRVSLLTKRHRQLRLHLAREHRDWSMDQWERVAWSDESRFVIHDADGLIRIRCLPGEQLLPRCTVGHKHADGGRVMLWRTFCWAFLGPVVVEEQTMNVTWYLNISANQLHPYMTSVSPAGNGMFQQGNAPCHKAKIV
ncbi:transposable element Tc1 transposase [Trichonephila clavipes]|nr:transposable element Tc1 transposase [Trichonephila clavipes]